MSYVETLKEGCLSSGMEKYVLSYFNYRGRAEPIRLLMADQGVPFTEHVIHEKEWASLKIAYPFQQVPCLRVDNQITIAQTGAILRYFARKLGLNGTTNESAAYVDMLFESTRDWRQRYQKLIYEEYEEQKENYIEHFLSRQIAVFEQVFASRDFQGPYILGKSISFADYALFEEISVSLLLSTDCLNEASHLQKFYDVMSERQRIKIYMARRAERNFPVNGNGKQ